MALQVPDQVALLPRTSAVPSLSVSQAKAALLALGEEADAERRERPRLFRTYSTWIALGIAVAGAAVPIIGAVRSGRGQRSRLSAGARAAPAALSLGLILRLLRPALPFILRFFARRRQARAARIAHNGRESRWAYR